MKVYTVYIDSYETDNPCATYDYSEDYPTFEEAQEALENSFWAFEDSHSLTKRQSDYNRNTNSFEEIPNSRYYYSFEITPNSFCISGDWSDYSGHIEETEISESLPFGHWRYVDKHGLPKENGIYLVSCTAEEWEIEENIRPLTYTEYACYNAEDKCFHNDNGYNYNVYAWTEVIKPASK